MDEGSAAHGVTGATRSGSGRRSSLSPGGRLDRETQAGPECRWTRHAGPRRLRAPPPESAVAATPNTPKGVVALHGHQLHCGLRRAVPRACGPLFPDSMPLLRCCPGAVGTFRFRACLVSTAILQLRSRAVLVFTYPLCLLSLRRSSLSACSISFCKCALQGPRRALHTEFASLLSWLESRGETGAQTSLTIGNTEHGRFVHLPGTGVLQICIYRPEFSNPPITAN